ncbi:hypothetical protein L7F22_066204 [Adiantum nelumboides]|nr:hypothetical protein [Adiantum nelumboides]MCO5611944.1 hypothetical protein [Adiantum nelumboides]
MELQHLWRAVAAERAAVVAQLVGGILLIVLLFFLLRRQPRVKLPPSPFPSLPLLGHVFHLETICNTGTTPTLRRLRDKLGPIFTLHVGNTLVIYITSAGLAHEALVGKGLLFAACPLFPSRALFTNNFCNINSATYGPRWRALRRNLVQEMFAAPKISAFKPMRNHVFANLMSSIRREAGDSHGVVSVFAQLWDAMFQLIVPMCFGFDMPKERGRRKCAHYGQKR